MLLLVFNSVAKIHIFYLYDMVISPYLCNFAQIYLVIVAFLLNLQNKQIGNITRNSSMKQFFKNVAATVVGIFAFGVIMFMLGFFSLIGMFLSSDKPSLRSNTVMVMKLNGTISDQVTENVFGKITGNSFNQLGMNEILSAIKKAKKEDKIKGIYIEVSSVSTDYATLQEIRNALADFKKSGKWIIAYGDMMDQGSYYLASVANKVFINPSGSVDWHGLAAEPMFLKDLYAKFGVKFTIVKVGKFKSYTEQYTEDKMTDANREQVTRYINGIWQQMLTDVSQSRGISKDALNHYADGILMTEDAQQLRDCNMVDGLCFYDEIKNEVKRQLGIDKDKSIHQASIYEVNEAVDDNTSGNAIAVYYLQGSITQQPLTGSFGTEQQIVASTVINDLNSFADDDNIKAVVLRINSGGGDAYASEQIWRAVTQLNNKKPVVVSMGGAAASGAYYISSGARYIVAQPTTLTGSIGIFGAFPDLSGLITQKLGVKFDEVKTNKNSGYQAALMARPFTAEEISYFQNYVDRGYELFRQRVAEGRKMSEPEVEEIAQGRVWLGKDALGIKLVDALGNLDKAISVAASLAKTEDKYHVEEYPLPGSWMDQLLETANNEGGNHLDEQLRLTLGEYYTPFMWLRRANEREPIQASLPFILNVK